MRSHFVSFSVFLVFCVAAVHAQYTTASLGGTVLDPGGAAVPQATVRVENMDTGLVQTTGTGSAGQFVFSTLPVGRYRDSQWRSQGPATHQNDDQYMGKIDYNLGRQQISGRYFDTRFKQPPAIFTDNILAADSGGSEVHIRNVAANHTFTVRPTLLFNTWFGWNSQTGGTIPSARFGWPDIGVKIAQPDRNHRRAISRSAEPSPRIRFGGASSIGAIHSSRGFDLDQGQSRNALRHRGSAAGKAFRQHIPHGRILRVQ